MLHPRPLLQEHMVDLLLPVSNALGPHQFPIIQPEMAYTLRS